MKLLIDFNKHFLLFVDIVCSEGQGKMQIIIRVMLDLYILFLFSLLNYVYVIELHLGLSPCSGGEAWVSQ